MSSLPVDSILRDITLLDAILVFEGGATPEAVDALDHLRSAVDDGLSAADDFACVDSALHALPDPELRRRALAVWRRVWTPAGDGG